MVQSMRVRVVVIQGYCLFRNTLIERLEKEPWIEVCAAASGMEEARKLIGLHRPHVLVVNVSLKCSEGGASLTKLKRDFPGMSVVALSCDSEFESLYAGQALRAGADGYISSMDRPDDLVEAIGLVRPGSRFLSRRTQSVQRNNAAGEDVLAGLSKREAEVFCLTGCGYVTQRIAGRMNLSVKTVETYRERIRTKMNLPSGGDLLYVSTSFMRNAARRGIAGSDDQVVRALLSTTR